MLLHYVIIFTMIAEEDIVILCRSREYVHSFCGYICRDIKQQPLKKVLQIAGCLSGVHIAKLSPGLFCGGLTCFALSDSFLFYS